MTSNETKEQQVSGNASRMKRRIFIKTIRDAAIATVVPSVVEAGVQAINRAEILKTGKELLLQTVGSLIEQNVSPFKRYVVEIQQSGVKEDDELQKLKVDLANKELEILKRRLSTCLAIAKKTYDSMDSTGITQDYNELIKTKAYTDLQDPRSPVSTLLALVQSGSSVEVVARQRAKASTDLFTTLKPKFEKMIKELLTGYLSPEQVQQYITKKSHELLDRKGVTDQSLRGKYVALLLAIARTESGFNTMAVSSSGATGVYQFVRGTFIETINMMNNEGVNNFGYIAVPADTADTRYNSNRSDAGKKLNDPRHHAMLNVDAAFYRFEQGEFYHWKETYVSDANWKMEAKAVGMGDEYVKQKKIWTYH